MDYLVVYKEGGEEKKDIIGDAKSATTFIEELIRDKNISRDEIDLHEMTKVEYDVKHVPVVTISSGSYEEEKYDLEESRQIVEGMEDVQEKVANEDSLEVFTFES